MSVCGFEHDDGAYVLGALSPTDRVAFEEHLPDCERCSQSIRQLAGLPGLLARVPIEVVDPSEPALPVPDTLLPRLLRQARRTQRRRTVAFVGLAAAALTAVAIGTAVITHDNTSTPPTAAAQQFKAVASGPLSGWVSLTPVSWGTRLDLTCAYVDGGTGYATTYILVVTHADGTTETVTSWKAVPGKTIHISAGTAATRSEIADVSVRDAAGNTVLRLHGN